MKKFDKPFDDYEISSERPINIELRAQGFKRYLHLKDNPLYYYYAFQFVGGDFYRAVLGYENIWDRTVEESLVSSLDQLLTKHVNSREYYLEEITFTAATKLWGNPWRRGIKPALNFRAKQCRPVEANTKALARINILDAPKHVDIEFEDGSIISVSYMNYLRWKRKYNRSSDNAKTNSPNRQQNGSDAKDGQRGKAGTVERIDCYIAPSKIYPNVFNLRKRF